MNIGDTVYRATFENREKIAVCPYCNGDKYLTITFGDGTSDTIQCDPCKSTMHVDYERNSTGYVHYYEHEAKVTEHKVTGLQVYDGKIVPTISSSSFRPDYILHPDRESAQAQADAMQSDHNVSEATKHTRRDHRHKSWSHQATYHRSSLKRATRDVEYHGKMVNYAALMVAKYRKEKKQ